MTPFRRFVWRFVYGCVDSRVAVALTRCGVTLAARLIGEVRAQGLLSAFERRVVISGWPHHSAGWVNLHLSRFLWRVRHSRRVMAAPVKSGPPVGVNPRAAGRAPIRVGCIGRFRGLLSFPLELFEGFPPEAELHLFDLEYAGACADYLEAITPHYVTLKATSDYVAVAAEAINRADLDVLVNANAKADAYALLDRIDTPCVLNFCPGSDFVHHDRVAVQMNGQPQADYFIVGRRMFCGTTARIFAQQPVYPLRGYYDPRGIQLVPQKRWADRKPLIVFHGSLYKLAQDEVLRCLFTLVADDPSLAFVMMGKDSADALSCIDRAARRHGVASRVHYEGAFESARSHSGIVADHGWRKLRSYLADARLAPDPWPIGGASSRFEAYAMGVPSVHMAVRFDEASWGRPQLSVCEVPHMLIPQSAASTVREYRAISQRCLCDQAFADTLAVEQTRVARELGDPGRLWYQVFDCYREWLESSNTATTRVLSVLHGIGGRPAREPVPQQAR